MFVVGKNTVSMILREVVNGINEALRQEIFWLVGDRLRETQEEFLRLCGLLVVLGAIDGMHISISKPKYGLADYFYFKTGGGDIR
jgi:hypothetical protein